MAGKRGENKGSVGGAVLAVTAPIVVIVLLLASMWFGNVIFSSLDKFYKPIIQRMIKDQEVNLPNHPSTALALNQLHSVISFWLLFLPASRY